MYKVRKMCEVLVFLAILGVFPLGMITYTYFTVPKFMVNQCILFGYGPDKIYTITGKSGFRYILDNHAIVSVEFTDKNAKKVRCE